MGHFYNHYVPDPARPWENGRRGTLTAAGEAYIMEHRRPPPYDGDRSEAQAYADSLATGGLRKVMHVDEYSGSRMHTFEPVNPHLAHPMDTWMRDFKLKPLLQIRINNASRTREEAMEFEQAWREQQRALGNEA